jgi:hypothetical protein
MVTMYNCIRSKILSSKNHSSVGTDIWILTKNFEWGQEDISGDSLKPRKHSGICRKSEKTEHKNPFIPSFAGKYLSLLSIIIPPKSGYRVPFWARNRRIHRFSSNVSVRYCSRSWKAYAYQISAYIMIMEQKHGNWFWNIWTHYNFGQVVWHMPR